MFGPGSLPYRHVPVNGAAGIISVANGRIVSVTAPTVVGGRMPAIDVPAGAARTSAPGLTIPA